MKIAKYFIMRVCGEIEPNVDGALDAEGIEKCLARMHIDMQECLEDFMPPNFTVSVEPQGDMDATVNAAETACWVDLHGDTENLYRETIYDYEGCAVREEISAYCSSCGEIAYMNEGDVYKYCPHCGAKMEEVE